MTHEHTPKPANLTEAQLETLFDAGRAMEPLPSSALMAKIIADATSSQLAFSVATETPVYPAKSRFWASVSEVLGGWSGVSTMAACACVGLVVGIAGPDTVLSFVPSEIGGQSNENEATFNYFLNDADLSEGEGV